MQKKAKYAMIYHKQNLLKFELVSLNFKFLSSVNLFILRLLCDYHGDDFKL